MRKLAYMVIGFGTGFWLGANVLDRATDVRNEREINRRATAEVERRYYALLRRVEEGKR